MGGTRISFVKRSCCRKPEIKRRAIDCHQTQLLLSRRRFLS